MHIRTTPIVALLCLITSLTFAQSDEQIAAYFKEHPQADLNGDGILTREEARIYRQQARRDQHNNARHVPDPTHGDNLKSTSKIPGIEISESVSPVIEVPLESADGIDLGFAYRKPGGEGPFPVILFFHGGGEHADMKHLRQNLTTGAVQTRFLKEGFAIVQSTRRQYWKTEDNPDKVGYFDAIKDATLVIRKVKTLPGIDPNKVILYGGSGGAILAIGAASQNELLCVVAGEPATILLLKPMTDDKERPDYAPINQDPLGHYTGEVKRRAQALFKAIDCPVLLLQGDSGNVLDKINNQLLIPEMKAMHKDISSIRFPGLAHGFYWGSAGTGATLETIQTIVRDVTAFIARQTSHHPGSN